VDHDCSAAAYPRHKAVTTEGRHGLTNGVAANLVVAGEFKIRGKAIIEMARRETPPQFGFEL